MPIDCNPPQNSADRLPDSISTPEGDIGADPTASDEGLAIPPGNAPSPYDSDKKPKGLEKFVDEVVRGEYM
jgi:hypothetical protein